MGRADEDPADWFAEAPPPLGRAEAARAVRWPAAALAVAGWLGIGVGVFRLFVHLILLGGILTLPGGPNPGAGMRALAAGLAAALDVVLIAWGMLVVVGAGRMRRRRGYGLALAGVIVAMLPANYCWLLGLPFGIWALAVLLRPEVRGAFD
jgi:hypothetical protein